MAFHETAIFPTNISRGSSGGVGMGHNVFELDSGALSAIARWAKPRRTFNVRYGIRTYADLRAVHDFYIAREGTSNGFRYFWDFDHSTASDHRSAPTKDDETLGQGDGVTVIFQLLKTYTDSGTTRTRTIEKPISGTVLVAIDGVLQTEDTGGGGDYTVDYSTGEILFGSAPNGGGTPETVTAGCDYHTPVQFGPGTDELLNITHEAVEAGDIPDIELYEMVGNTSTPELPWTGRSSFQIIGASTLYDYSMGHTVSWLPNAANLFVTLPEIKDLDDGGPLFSFMNNGSFSLDFRNRSGGGLEFTLAVGQGAQLYVIDVSGTNTWEAIVGI